MYPHGITTTYMCPTANRGNPSNTSDQEARGIYLATSYKLSFLPLVHSLAPPAIFFSFSSQQCIQDTLILIRETPCPGIGYARLSLAGAVKSLRHCALPPHPIIEVGREDGGLETEVSRQLCVNVPEGFLRSHDDASDAQEELQQVYTLHEHERAKGIPDQFSPTNGRDYVSFPGSHRQNLTSCRSWCEPCVVSLYMALATH